MYYLVGQKEETATLVYIERKEREQNKRRPLESRLCKENQRGFDAFARERASNTLLLEREKVIHQKLLHTHEYLIVYNTRTTNTRGDSIYLNLEEEKGGVRSYIKSSSASS